VSLFVADSADNQIRKISLSNFNVTTIGGGGSGYNSACCSLNFAKPGALDGIGVASSFSSPKWITTDGTYLYVTDTGNNKIRKIVIATNEVSTLTTSATFSGLQGITTDGTNLYVVDNSGIRMVVIATGTVSTISLVNATGGSVSLTSTDITTDGVNLFVTDSVGYGSIHKIVISSGVTTLLAGNPSATRCQDNNGTGTSASFCNPRGITTDGTYLYVAGNDSMASGANNAEIRKVVISTGQVTTLAGGGAQWDTDAVGTLAGFRDLFGITTNGVSLFAVDNTKIREIQ
jgi:hypothetical protein